MGALHGFTARQSGEFRHVADEADAGHIGDESIAFRHVADRGAQFAQIAFNFLAENAGRAGDRLIKSQQRIDQG